MTGRFAVAYTSGLQNGSLDARYVQVVVTLKHWDAYSLENYDNVTRHNYDAQISNYDLTSTYFPAFKAAVMEANALGVMCAYNVHKIGSKEVHSKSLFCRASMVFLHVPMIF